MSSLPRRRRKSSTGRRVLWAVLLVLVFAVGIALGQALEDNPQPGSTITPGPDAHAAAESATVTVTRP